MVYDNLGRQTSLTDPDAGTITYSYNNFNELTKQTDLRGIVDSLTYDILGRVATQVRNEGIKVYTYDPAGNPGLLDSVSYSTGSVNYNYDSASRLTEKITRIDGTSYSASYGYDSYSRLQTLTYPSGFAIKNVYNTYGYQSEVRRNDNNALIWQGQNVNTFGQFTQYIYGNNLTTTKTYDCLGMLRNISTGSVQDMDYSFDYETGNMLRRKDNLQNLTEIFTFDNLDRLTGVIGPAPLTMTYASSGNILSKTSIGNYSYEGSKPHAVTSVTNPDGLIPTNTQRITYTSFNKVDSIIQGNLIYTIAYGSDDQRTMSKLLNNGVPEKTTYYNGGYVKEVSPGNNIRQLHYIEGGDGLAAVFVRNNGQDTMYYIHKDHLGSINVITDQNGAVIQNCSFDAWGRRRNPADWSYDDFPESFFLDRGFTGHEHLDQFGLINMNGRVYDPAIARFLSPDNFVQSPYLTQAFNRYTYCLNNPLRYIDPSGMRILPGDWEVRHNGARPYRLLDTDGRGGFTTILEIPISFINGNRQEIRDENNKLIGILFRGLVGYYRISIASGFDEASGQGGVEWGAYESLAHSGHVTNWTSEALESIANFSIKQTAQTVRMTAKEVEAARVIGNVGKVARVTGIAGEVVVIGVNGYNVWTNPTSENIARAGVAGFAIGLNAVNFLVPGLGTGFINRGICN